MLHIKNKYSERFIKNQIPKIINNFNGRKEYWVFLNVNSKINDNQIIILKNVGNININDYNIIDNDKDGCLFIEKKNG